MVFNELKMAMPTCVATSPLPPGVTMPSTKSVGLSGMGIGLQRSCVGVASTSLNGALLIKPLSMRALGRCTTDG
jgi:hypothetical protein